MSPLAFSYSNEFFTALSYPFLSLPVFFHNISFVMISLLRWLSFSLHTHTHNAQSLTLAHSHAYTQFPHHTTQTHSRGVGVSACRSSAHTRPSTEDRKVPSSSSKIHLSIYLSIYLPIYLSKYYMNSIYFPLVLFTYFSSAHLFPSLSVSISLFLFCPFVRFIHHLTRFQAHGDSGALEIKMHRWMGSWVRQIDVTKKGEERGGGGATALVIIITTQLKD